MTESKAPSSSKPQKHRDSDETMELDDSSASRNSPTASEFSDRQALVAAVEDDSTFDVLHDEKATMSVALVTADGKMRSSEILREMFTILVPADISSMLWMSSQTVTMMFVGKDLGSLAVAQYSVGIMVFNVCGISILTGMGSAIDTFVSQAYGRDPLSPQIGAVLQRSLVVCFALCIPVTALFEFVIAPAQVRLFGEEIGGGAAEFLRWAPIYLVAILVGATIRRTMLATRAADLVVYANAAAAVASIVANVLFTHRGIGYGTVMTLASISFFNALAYVLLCLYHPKMACVRAAEWPSRKAVDIEEIKGFLVVAVPAMIAMCAEWWAFDMIEVFTVYVGKDAVAAFGVCMNLLVMLFSVSLGVGISASTLVGNALGANCPIRAKQYVRTVLTAGTMLSSSAALAMWYFQDPIVHWFINDPVVVAIVKDCVPVVAVCHVGDCIQFALQGFYRGAGHNSAAAVAILLTLWGLGLPAAGIFCLYFKLGTKGTFLGLLTGFFIEISVLLLLMTRWDWNALAARASQTTTDEKLEGQRAVAVEAPGTTYSDAAIVVIDEEEMDEAAP